MSALAVCRARQGLGVVMRRNVVLFLFRLIVFRLLDDSNKSAAYGYDVVTSTLMSTSEILFCLNFASLAMALSACSSTKRVTRTVNVNDLIR